MRGKVCRRRWGAGQLRRRSPPLRRVGSGSGIAGWRQRRIAASADAQPRPASKRQGLHADAPPPRPSMAETLRDAFGLASPDGHASAPGLVRAAYGKLRSFGL